MERSAVRLSGRLRGAGAALNGGLAVCFAGTGALAEDGKHEVGDNVPYPGGTAPRQQPYRATVDGLGQGGVEYPI